MHAINEALEAEYNNRALVPEHSAIFERWRRDSAVFRASATCALDLTYGAEPRHRLDIFHAPNPRGTVVFIHGGYWRSLDKSDFSFVAAPFIAAGLSVVAINYRLCPMVHLSEVVEDCRAALEWLLKNGSDHQLPLAQIALTGHSAGGHLVAMLYATDWRQRKCDASGIIGGMALSGVYDLEPLIHCSMNAELRLNHHIARAASPIKLESLLNVPLHLAAGALESSAFRTQSQQLSAVWPQICQTPQEIEGANHFTIVDSFVQPGDPTFERVLRMFS
ncbi:MAG: alpha/beta hydrolase [Betaproteobacteria bacterium]